MNLETSEPIYKEWTHRSGNGDQTYVIGNREASKFEVHVDHGDLKYFNRLTDNNKYAKYVTITTIFDCLLRRMIFDFDGRIISDAIWSNTPDQKRPFILSFRPELSWTFKEYLQYVKLEIATVYKNSGISELPVRATVGVDNLDDLPHYGITMDDNSKLECNGILLILKISDRGDLDLSLTYLAGVLNETIICHVGEVLRKYICNLENYITDRIAKYSLLNEQEERQLLDEFNDTSFGFLRNKTVVNLFEERVVKSPENLAVLFENEELTYKQLNERINKLANYLLSKYQIKKGEIIGVLLPKSIDGLVTFFAILKMGAAYLPIDINNPEDRIKYIVEDSRLRIIITDRSAMLNVNGCQIIDIQSVDITGMSEINVGIDILPADVVYVIYTSGSTGRPKGVEIRNISNINMSTYQIKTLGLSEVDRVVWFANVAFDASISEIMMTLFSGATLCIPSPYVINDKDLFANYLKKLKISVITFPPSYLDLLSNDDISSLRCLITAGESPNIRRASEILKLGVEYFNAYGPTECAVCATMHKVTIEDCNNSSIPIGKPISNTRIYIVNHDLHLLPIGVMGSIYIAGIGLAKSYLNNPKLTAERFINSPFKKDEKIYDTGDLGCWLPDGNIKFWGRKDNQVKIRGNRIELEEIEYTLLQFSVEIKQALVVAKEINDESVLVAYLVSELKLDEYAVKLFLHQKLPEYMIPAFIISLTNMPTTPNGKIDRNALLDLSEQDTTREFYDLPRNLAEREVIDIWKEVLSVKKIGIKDNFFVLGGHSLMVSQVINRIQKRINKTISFKEFFSNPTVEGICQNFEHTEFKYSEIKHAGKKPFYSTSSAQKSLYVLQLMDKGIAYNMPCFFKIKGEFREDRCEYIFAEIIKLHESLRTSFKMIEGEIVQIVNENFNFNLEKYYVESENEIASVASEFVRPFNLNDAPLIRAGLITVNKKTDILLIDMHHIISDGESVKILIGDFIKLYAGKPLAKLTIQSKDYIEWQKGKRVIQGIDDHRTYWADKLRGEFKIASFKTDFRRPDRVDFDGATMHFEIQKDLFGKLQILSQESGTSLYIVLVTAFKIFLFKYSHNEDVIIGTDLAGRNRSSELDGVVGMFINSVVLRSKLSEFKTGIQLLKEVKETLFEAIEHQDYYFDEIMQDLNIKRLPNRNPLFDIMFTIMNNPNQIYFDGSLQVEPYEAQLKTSKFDMTWMVHDADTRLHIYVSYQNKLYLQQTIIAAFEMYKNILQQFVEFPEMEIGKMEINVLIKKEKNKAFDFDFQDWSESVNMT